MEVTPLPQATTVPARVLLSPDDVADLLSVSRRHVYTLLGRGCLARVRVGRLLRIPSSAVDAFIASGGRAA